MSKKILEIAHSTISIESNSIARLKEQIGESFVNCVHEILKCNSRVIITGIGKSAIIGQKIVATLNSTGTPSIFLHAADAIHGDIGMIKSDDLVLCISKSGETLEIKALIPILHGIGIKLIAMVGKKDSYLAKHADFVLLTPIQKEADPNNLAPTASTAVQLAMGDALAMALLVSRGFTERDFAQYHPGGALGKKLYLKVEHIYPANEKPMVSLDASIREVIVEITSKRLGMTAVTNASGVLKGIITDGDLRRMLERETNTEHLIAQEIMTPQPKTVSSKSLATEALKFMQDFSITQLLVVDDEDYKGVIHLHDLIREGLV
ncbi:MAG: KpsF/GutQ family sugar-phosphate isomerase [Bacteroidia bacterium]|nr:KpsF/GutQ family sugar-phosphate isomerase [Bacteroidia bacterium]